MELVRESGWLLRLTWKKKVCSLQAEFPITAAEEQIQVNIGIKRGSRNFEEIKSIAPTVKYERQKSVA